MKLKTLLMNRGAFLRTLALGAAAPFLLSFLNHLPGGSRLRKYLRPPGALPEKEFLDACIGCGQCANVCPNKCITLQGLESGLDHLATPVISARAKGCILCMACTQVCPTGALEKLEPTPKGRQAVRMGTAVVAEDLCYSFAGRTCGVCYRACPLPGKAMKLGLYEQPHVNPDYCVGCGLCEQACVHMPQAIRVIPRDTPSYAPAPSSSSSLSSSSSSSKSNDRARGRGTRTRTIGQDEGRGRVVSNIQPNFA